MKKSESRFRRVALNVVEVTPLAVIIILAIFGATSVTLLLLEKFNLLTTVLLAAPLSAAALVYLYKTYQSSESFHNGSQKERLFCGVVLLVGVAAWVGFNSFYNAQHVFTNRDPATYAVAGAWLVDNETIDIPRLPELTAIKGIKDTAAGFGVSTQDTQEIYAQGTHILPAFLGLFGRVVGKLKIYPLNVVFGGAALLSLYAFARLLVKPRWALVSVMILGASLPMLYFSRDTYTEPLALVFTFGGLALLVEAYKRQKSGYWLLAGFVFGATVLTRVDAYMALAFIIPSLAIYLASAASSDRRRRLQQIILFIVGVLVTSVIGYLDVKYLSSGYFRHTWSLVRQELLLITWLSVAGAILVVVAWRTSILQKLDLPTKRWRAALCAALLLVGMIALFVRPLVYDEYHNKKTIDESGSVQVERVRNYKEEAPYWVAWYIGPLATALGMGGLTVMVYRATKGGDKNTEIYILFGGLVLGTALIYFVKPSIASDQIWASRRMLPVIMPGFTVAATFLLQELYEGRLSLRRKRGINYEVLSSVLATIAVFMPLIVSVPFIDKAPFTQLAGITGTCEALPKNSVVLWVGLAKHEAPITTRTFCGVPSVGLYGNAVETNKGPEIDDTTIRKYGAIVRASGGIPIIGRFDSDLLVDLLEEDGSAVVADGSFMNVEYVKGRPPRTNVQAERFVRLSIVQADGSTVPVGSHR